MKPVIALNQSGPTCGIFALSMIIKSFYEIPESIDLPYEILKLALNSNNKISRVGEIFTTQNMLKLIDEINKYEMFKSFGINLEANIKTFRNVKDFEKIITSSLKSEKYIVMAYNPEEYYRIDATTSSVLNKLNYTTFSLMKKLIFDRKHFSQKNHWAVIYDIDRKKRVLKGEQSSAEARKKGVLLNTSIDHMYEANKNISNHFIWKHYFSTIGNELKNNKLRNHSKHKLTNLIKSSTSYQVLKTYYKPDFSDKVNLTGSLIMVGKAKEKLVNDQAII